MCQPTIGLKLIPNSLYLAHSHVLERFSPTEVARAFPMFVVSSIPAISGFAIHPFKERFHRALMDMRRGHPVILVDDFDRENEAT